MRSARANLAPGLVLQAFALAVVLGYYFHGPTREWLSQLGDLRMRMGAAFGILSTALFGGLLPLLCLKSTRATRDQYSWGQGGFLTFFWGLKGAELALWYGFLAWSVGPGNDPGTVAVKALIDQLVYCPIWAIPSTTLASKRTPAARNGAHHCSSRSRSQATRRAWKSMGGSTLPR